ncbi:zinc finger protein, partial [Clarias magur]
LDGQHGAAIAPYTHPGARQRSGERRGSRVCHLGVRGHEGFLSDDDHVFLCGKCKKQFNSLPGVLDSQKGAVPAGRPIARHCFAGLQQHLHTCTACRRCAATTGEQT